MKHNIICKKAAIGLFAMLYALGVGAQKISFEKSTITTPTTAWKLPVTATFKFTNKERTPLIIRNVDAGCGCMSVKWPSAPIQRNESGEISVTYDAKLLGHFDKIIEVETNAGGKPTRLRMKGLVSNGNRKAVEDLYPYQIGDILLSTNNIEFNDVNLGDSATMEIEIFNNSKEVYTPQLMHLPEYLSATFKPEMLARGRRGKIYITLHSDKLPDLGLNQTNIYLARFFGDKVNEGNDITVSAVQLPDLHFAEQFAKKPDFKISTTEVNLGKMGKKKKVTGKVILKNNGTGVLKLSKIQAFNQAVTVALKQTEIQPGEEVVMNVSVDSRFLGMSKAKPRVLIITNDPKHPKEVVNVKFEK